MRNLTDYWLFLLVAAFWSYYPSNIELIVQRMMDFEL